MLAMLMIQQMNDVVDDVGHAGNEGDADQGSEQGRISMWLRSSATS